MKCIESNVLGPIFSLPNLHIQQGGGEDPQYKWIPLEYWIADFLSMETFEVFSNKQGILAIK